MKKVDIAYIAGIIDGEGCISIWRRHRVKSSDVYYTAICVSMGMTSEWMIRWMQMLFGGSVYKNKRHPLHKDSWQWNVRNERAMEMIKLILPYLKLKRGQAELAIKFHEAKAIRGLRHKTPGDLVVEQAQLVVMRAMNKRGVFIEE